jgi:hypothetical protein
MERGIDGWWTPRWWRGRAKRFRARRPWSRCGADIDGPNKRDGSARPDRHSTGRVGSHRSDGVPTIFPHHLRRGVELGDRQRHGICDRHERRAARRHQVPTPRLGGRSPLPRSTPVLLGLSVRGAVFHLVSRDFRLGAHNQDPNLSRAEPLLFNRLVEVGEACFACGQNESAPKTEALPRNQPIRASSGHLGRRDLLELAGVCDRDRPRLHRLRKLAYEVDV